MARLALGLDSSTQSLSSVIVDIDNAEKIFEHSLDYRQDERLNDYGIGSDYVLPPRIEIGDRTVLFNHEAELYPHHLGVRLDFTMPIAKVTQHPKDPQKWGLQNLSNNDWNCTTKDGRALVVPHKKSLPLLHGMRIQFGSVEGQLLS